MRMQPRYPVELGKARVHKVCLRGGYAGLTASARQQGSARTRTRDRTQVQDSQRFRTQPGNEFPAAARDVAFRSTGSDNLLGLNQSRVRTDESGSDATCRETITCRKAIRVCSEGPILLANRRIPLASPRLLAARGSALQLADGLPGLTARHAHR